MLPGKDPEVVRLFFDIVYGATGPVWIGQNASVTEKEHQLLQLAKAYALADELDVVPVMTDCTMRMGVIFSTVYGNDTLDLHGPMLWIQENSARQEMFLRTIARSYFYKHKTRLLQPFDTTGTEGCTYLSHFMENTDQRTILATVFAECSPLFRNGLQGRLRKAVEHEGFARAMLETAAAGKTLNFTTLRNIKGFEDSVRASGLAYDMYVREIDDAFRVGKTLMYSCDGCRALLLSGSSEMDNTVNCCYCNHVGYMQINEIIQVDNDMQVPIWHLIDDRWGAGDLDLTP